jgi:RHS repeat-associated protein
MLYEGDSTRLYYARNRWYSPEFGGFISEDPLSIGGGLNTYAFAGSDPVNGSDPYGLNPLTEYGLPPQLPGFGGDARWNDSASPSATMADVHNDPFSLRALGSIAAGFVPGLSEGSDAVTALSGYDAIAGERVGVAGRLVAGVGVIIPVVSGGQIRSGEKFIQHEGPALWSRARILSEWFTDLEKSDAVRGAEARLASRTITPGVTREMLTDFYSNIAQNVVNGAKRGKFNLGKAVQIARMRLIDEALRYWPR